MKRRGFLQCLGLLGAASVVPAPMARGIAQLLTAGVVPNRGLVLAVTGARITEERTRVFLHYAAQQARLVDQYVVIPFDLDVRQLP